MLDRLLQQHASGLRDHSATLWSLLMLDAFLRRMQQPASGGSIAPPAEKLTAGVVS